MQQLKRTAWLLALCMGLAGCTDLKSDEPRDGDDAGDASAAGGKGGKGDNRGDHDGGPAASDRDGGVDGGPSLLPDGADDPAAIAGGGLLLQCAANAEACVAGSIVSGGANGSTAGSARLPNGGTVSLSDDGFELGGTTCDASGALCVTGGIAP